MNKRLKPRSLPQLEDAFYRFAVPLAAFLLMALIFPPRPETAPLSYPLWIAVLVFVLVGIGAVRGVSLWRYIRQARFMADTLANSRQELETTLREEQAYGKRLEAERDVLLSDRNELLRRLASLQDSPD